MGVEDAVFVVCGATEPFGLAVAQELIDGGARVLLVDRELEPLERAAEGFDGAAFPCVADFADAGDGARVAGVAAALLGGVDGIVLPAVALPDSEVLDLTHDAWLALFSQGVYGPLAALKGVVPLLEEQGGTVVFAVPAGPAASGAARLLVSTLETLVEELAALLGPAIRVERVEPAPEAAGGVARLLAPR